MGTEKISLTKELKAYVQEIGIDVFGIANIDRINEKARICILAIVIRLSTKRRLFLSCFRGMLVAERKCML